MKLILMTTVCLLLNLCYNFFSMHSFDYIDMYDMCCLELLYRQLYPRGVGKNAVFLKQIEVGVTTLLYTCIYYHGLCMQTCDIDLEHEVSVIEQSAPFILITGVPAGDENCQFFVCCEQAVYLESDS